MASKPETRTLLLETVDGQMKIEVPKDAKLTFGPAVPWAGGRNRDPYGGGGSGITGYTLRVYEGTNPIAVFTGIKSYRDIAMPIAKLVAVETGSKLWQSDEEGYKVEQQVKRKRSFKALKVSDDTF